MKQDNLAKYGSELGLRSMLLHDAIAQALGLHLTDHKCLLFLMDGPKTAGFISTATRLTTGGVTAALDRLEQAGYISRKDDPTDRRRVLVIAEQRKLKRVQLMFEPLVRDMKRLEQKFDDGQREAIELYLLESGRILAKATEALRNK